MDVRPATPYNQRINRLGVTDRVPLDPESTFNPLRVDVTREPALPDFSLNLRDLPRSELGKTS